MAVLNKDYFSEEAYNDEKVHMELAMHLIGFLTNEELDKLKEDWKANGGLETMPCWKFALENIKVSY